MAASTRTAAYGSAIALLSSSSAAISKDAASCSGLVREAGDAAVGVVQDHQVPAPGWLALAKPAQQGP